jgi:tRNA pseudouridine13 synthase
MLIKQSPEDFIVEEVPLKEWDDAGPFAVFRLSKTNLNTEQAVDIISRKFHISKKDIKYSGTKDKHANTTQYLSIPARPGISGIQLDEENIKLEHVGFTDEPLSLGTLSGNRFIITVREIEDKELHAIKSRHAGLTIPNYFDEQRFSSNNYNIGLSILKRDYKNAVKYMCESSGIYSDTSTIYLAAHPNDYIGALQRIPKKTLLMFIHAVQSFIFNETLSNMLMENAMKKSIEYYIVPYSIGRFVFYKNCSDYDDLTESLELIGFDTKSLNHYTKQLLEESGLVQRDFIVRALPDLSAEGTIRECFVEVQNLETEIMDDRTILEFELSKGAYATIVVKALFNG